MSIVFLNFPKKVFQKHWQPPLNVISYIRFSIVTYLLYAIFNSNIRKIENKKAYEQKCIIFIRRNIEAVTTRRSWKPLGLNSHGGSNPSSCAKKSLSRTLAVWFRLFSYRGIRRGSGTERTSGGRSRPRKTERVVRARIESLFLRQEERNSNRVTFFIFYIDKGELFTARLALWEILHSLIYFVRYFTNCTVALLLPWTLVRPFSFSSFSGYCPTGYFSTNFSFI